MRHLFTAKDAARRGITPMELRWGERTGRWRRAGHGVYAEGADEPSRQDRALALVVATNGTGSGQLAGVLLGFDGVTLKGFGTTATVSPKRSGRRRGVRRHALDPARIVWVGGYRCTDALQTLLDLAAELDDIHWEQAVESALRLQLVRVEDIETAGRRTPGCERIRRVLKLRPPGAPPTESLLETLTVQLARLIPGLPPPERQYVVVDQHGEFVARVDLAWPELGLFIELDGQHHANQPVYDARRETAVVAATGWLCGRFTWTEVVRYPTSTSRRLADLAAQARRRPLVP
jgi:hypothetical protein